MRAPALMISQAQARCLLERVVGSLYLGAAGVVLAYPTARSGHACRLLLARLHAPALLALEPCAACLSSHQQVHAVHLAVGDRMRGASCRPCTHYAVGYG
jgi:hypothetical protein